MPTTPDILGPYYQPDAPFRTRIASPQEPGKRLVIEGTVSDCSGPVRGALIELWQANADGCYSINEDCGVIPGSPDEFRLRGRIKTSESGAYEFETIKPAPYNIGRGRFRPSHIHYRVTAPGSGYGNQLELITQLYFEGEKYNDTDPYSSRPEAESRTISLTRDPHHDILSGQFNIVLPGTSSEERAGRADYDLLILRDGERILFRLPPRDSKGYRLTLYTPGGCPILRWETSGRTIETTRTDMAPGSYLAHLRRRDELEAFHIWI